MGGGTLTSFGYTSLLVEKQKVYPIAGCNKSAPQLEAWAVFCTVFFGNEAKHPTTYEMFPLIEEIPSVGLQLQAQARQQPSSPTTLL